MELITERLLLREFVDEDWKAVLEYQSNPLYLRYYAWTERKEAEVREFVGWFLTNQQEQPRTKYQLAVTLKEDGRLIGNCGVRINDFALREGNIGYELDPRYWGKGYATEAARALVRFGFEELGLHRIWSWCVAENVSSSSVLERVGFRQEGCLWEKEFYKGRWWDQRVFGLLEHEWKRGQLASESL